MKKTLNKGLAAMLLAALMLLALSGCQVSSSSSSTTTVSTSVTDENGNTTTKTTTSEVGVTAGSDGVNTTSSTTSNTTTTPAGTADQAQSSDAEKEYADSLRDAYNEGAEGTCASGEKVYYAFNDSTSDVYMVIISADGQNFSGRAGTILSDGDKHIIQSTQMGDEIEFTASDVDEQGNFTMTFLGDGDVAQMHLVDQDTIVNDMAALARDFNLL